MDATGGSASQKYTLGIGMNYPEFDGWWRPPDFRIPCIPLRAEKWSDRPSQCIVFADAGDDFKSLRNRMRMIGRKCPPLAVL